MTGGVGWLGVWVCGVEVVVVGDLLALKRLISPARVRDNLVMVATNEHS